jgi:hypothetical protein
MVKNPNRIPLYYKNGLKLVQTNLVYMSVRWWTSLVDSQYACSRMVPDSELSWLSPQRRPEFWLYYSVSWHK